jgi:3-oxoacyl-[acyl-carrier protein] reductase
MNKNFSEQVAIVTGGTRGIGAAISKSFLEHGAKVIATYQSNTSAAEQFKSSLGPLGEHLELASFDVSNYKACEQFFKDLSDKHEQIHILVNNSGIRKDQLLAAMSENDWDDVINTNLKGTFNMSKFAVLKFMRARYGRIVNISSVAANIGLPGQANYSATKAAQIALSKSLAKEVAKRNITVNNVLPGFIDTDLTSTLPPELVKTYLDQIPCKRFGTPEEVAHAVLFLASKEASYITAASLEISGGL